MKIITACFVFTFPLAVLSSEYLDLEGKYYIGGKTAYDAPANEPKSTHMYIHLTGMAAEEMYHLIKSLPKYDECLDDGSQTKFSGDIQCTVSKDISSYSCYFSLNSNNQEIGPGIVC